jgi:ADP-ribose pyrophosphatase
MEVMKVLKATIKKVDTLHSGFLKLSRYDFEVERHGGDSRILTWEVMVRGNAVAVLGYDSQRDQIVLVNEFRPGALIGGDYPFTDNLVAGGIGSGEVNAAVREMQEETGLRLRDPMIIHPGAYVSSGGTSEKVALVVGFVDTEEAGGVHGNPSESEDILTRVLWADEFIRRVTAAEITDLKTLLAGYWFAANRERLRSRA